MATFEEAFHKIAEGIADMSSLEVVTYKGTISIQNTGAVPKSFTEIIDNAQSNANLEITACTYVELDGDMMVFYDKDATAADKDAHHKLVETASQNRQAVVDLFKDAIIKMIKI